MTLTTSVTVTVMNVVLVVATGLRFKKYLLSLLILLCLNNLRIELGLSTTGLKIWILSD